VSTRILVVDDEADVRHCSANSSGARFVMAASRWISHARQPKRFS
jgi:hypothetical protein